MDIILKNYQCPTQRKEACLDLYVHQHPCPSWVDIAKILQDFDLCRQAEFVVNTYVKGTWNTVLTLIDDTVQSEAIDIVYVQTFVNDACQKRS